MSPAFLFSKVKFHLISALHDFAGVSSASTLFQRMYSYHCLAWPQVQATLADTAISRYSHNLYDITFNNWGY